MALASRDAIYQALFSRFKAKVTGVRFWSRRYLDFDQIPQGQQPAILVVATGERPINNPGFPPQWNLHASVLIFTRAPITAPSNPDLPTPETALLGFIDQVEKALERTASEAAGLADLGMEFETTLAGLTRRAWIAETVEIYQGAAGEQSIAVVPIEMLVTQ